MKILQKIIILGDPVVKKNTKRHSKNGGVYYTSKWKDYEKIARYQLAQFEPITLPYPVEIHMKFYPRTLRRFDFTNMAEGTQDLLQDSGHIVDDDWKHITPVFHGEHGGCELDRENPRVEVTIIK